MNLLHLRKDERIDSRLLNRIAFVTPSNDIVYFSLFHTSDFL